MAKVVRIRSTYGKGSVLLDLLGLERLLLVLVLALLLTGKLVGNGALVLCYVVSECDRLSSK